MFLASSNGGAFRVSGGSMGFIRVRQATGPAHEFDVPAAAYARKKHAYVVVDFEPVATPRPVKYVAALRVKSAGKPARPIGAKARNNVVGLVE